MPEGIGYKKPMKKKPAKKSKVKGGVQRKGKMGMGGKKAAKKY